MNWYRVEFRVRGKVLVSELQAHSTADALGVAAVKHKLGSLDASEITSGEIDVDCIDPPGWAVNAVRAAAKAVRP